ncbi:MAG: hypothetical protein PHH82_00470 [Candidatus ainarchaeum sp.]|nr:hypothetical protein [Candidatus ainarchaeum sp.]
MARKGQISLDLLLAVIIFAILFSVFFVFGNTIVEKSDLFKQDAELSKEANELRPYFAAISLPPEYKLLYDLGCKDKSFYTQDGNYFVSFADGNGLEKLIAPGNLDNYFCNTKVYFNK